MQTSAEVRRGLQIRAWIIAGLFVLGCFYHPVGMWTGTILGVWFVGTQRPWRGFLWLVTTTLLFSLPGIWHLFAQTVLKAGPAQVLPFCTSIAVTLTLAVLPLLFYRVVSPRLRGVVSTLSFPVAAIALAVIVSALKMGTMQENAALSFFSRWFATVVVWIWNHDFQPVAQASLRRKERVRIAGVFALAAAVTSACWLALDLSGTRLPQTSGIAFGWMCVGMALSMAFWTFFHPNKQRTWFDRADAVAKLKSTQNGDSWHVISEAGVEKLVSTGGEQILIRNGIPDFLQAQDLTGDNGKYNHLYETIGGFYDDTQRVFCALKGFDRDAFFRSYMDRLEVKRGDSVLETSVGTGLNFKYLPDGVQLTGLDLSAEMLAHCQANLRCWGMAADLYRGNAESLPFKDASFDVVFHSGGINFFNDRAKAIREMIRVAKPGSLLLIADETEKHVKGVYEKYPGELFKNRGESVSVPVELVPAEMQEIHAEILRGGDFYALTFRKPAEKASNGAELKAEMMECAAPGIVLSN